MIEPLKSYLTLFHIWIFNPILNLVPFFMIDVWDENMSHIGNAMNHPIYLLVWAFSSAFGFFYLSKTYWKIRRYNYKKKSLAFTCAGMFLSCIIPYSSSSTHWINDFHIWLAIVSVGAFVCLWLQFVATDFPLQNEKWRILGTIFVGLVLVIYPGHISAICEMYFSTVFNILILQLLFSENHAKIDSIKLKKGD